MRGPSGGIVFLLAPETAKKARAELTATPPTHKLTKLSLSLSLFPLTLAIRIRIFPQNRNPSPLFLRSGAASATRTSSRSSEEVGDLEQAPRQWSSADRRGMGETRNTMLKINGLLLSDGRHGNVWSLAWNPKPLNGAQHTLACCGDRTIVWQYQDSKWSQIAQLNNTGKGSVRCWAWCFDGTVLATGSADSKVTLWRYNQATQSFANIYEKSVPSGQVVKCLTWSKEGILLTCTMNGYICIFGINDDGQYKPKCRGIVSDIAEISCITWHPDGKQFAVGGHKCIKVLKVHEAGSNMTVKEILKIEDICDGGTCGICYSCNGTAIACAGQDGSVTFWKFEQKHSNMDPQLVHDNEMQGESPCDSAGAYLGKARGPKTQMCFDWSRCKNDSIGFLFASGSHHHEICVYATKLGTKGSILYPLVAPKVIDAHDEPITDLKWHHEDPGLLASASRDGSVKIWQVEGQTKNCCSLDEVSPLKYGKSFRAFVPTDDFRKTKFPCFVYVDERR